MANPTDTIEDTLLSVVVDTACACRAGAFRSWPSSKTIVISVRPRPINTVPAAAKDKTPTHGGPRVGGWFEGTVASASSSPESEVSWPAVVPSSRPSTTAYLREAGCFLVAAFLALRLDGSTAAPALGAANAPLDMVCDPGCDLPAAACPPSVTIKLLILGQIAPIQTICMPHACLLMQ